MKPPKNPKTREERVKDAVKILTRMKEVGIANTDPGYLETKKYLDDWIKTGDGATYKYKLHRYGRKVELILPTRAGVEPTCHLFAAEES